MTQIDKTFAKREPRAVQAQPPAPEPQQAPPEPPSDPELAPPPERLANAPDSALLAAVRRALNEQDAAMVAQIAHARATAELDAEVGHFQCIKCHRIAGQPAFCLSCVRQSRTNPNPRTHTALISRPTGVPMRAWRAALATLFAKLRPNPDGSAVTILLDQHVPLLRSAIGAAFEAAAQSVIDEAS